LFSEFKRHFDAGYARNIQFKDDMLSIGSDYKKGKDFVKKFLYKTFQINPLLLPYSTMVVMSKLLGYKLGAMAENWPLKIKVALSSQDFYWTSVYYKKNNQS
jgi:hypothetical protein